MIKIRKYNSSIECIDGKTVTITDRASIHIPGIRATMSDVRFILRKYHCKIYNSCDGVECSFIKTGIAKCSPQDTFSYETGKSIAGKRCWDKIRKTADRIVQDIVTRHLKRLKENIRY